MWILKVLDMVVLQSAPGWAGDLLAEVNDKSRCDSDEDQSEQREQENPAFDTSEHGKSYGTTMSVLSSILQGDQAMLANGYGGKREYRFCFDLDLTRG